MSRTLVFAYGSNMHPLRMRTRVPGASLVGRARIEGHRLVINKRGRDGSAKANLEADAEGVVWGVLWELTDGELTELDPHEGGYERRAFESCDSTGAVIEVEAYVSDRLTDDPVPFDWYLEHMIAGARAGELPEDYVAWLESFPSRPES